MAEKAFWRSCSSDDHGPLVQQNAVGAKAARGGGGGQGPHFLSFISQFALGHGELIRLARGTAASCD